MRCGFMALLAIGNRQSAIGDKLCVEQVFEFEDAGQVRLVVGGTEGRDVGDFGDLKVGNELLEGEVDRGDGGDGVDVGVAVLVWVLVGVWGPSGFGELTEGHGGVRR